MSPNRCVYIVDDDEAVRDSLSVLLESKAFGVRSFGSAPEFLATASSLPAGCLIIDIRMPEMDGLELQQHLTARSLNFPLIVITGHGDVPLAVRAMKAGAVDFIEKPFAAEAILNSLEAALSRLNTLGEDPAKAKSTAKLALLSRRELQVLKVSSPGCPTNRLLTICRSARAPSRFTARDSWTRLGRAAFPS